MSTGPHDALFKTIFSQREHAAGELACVLPKALVERLDFSTLTLLPSSFVDEALGDSHADLVYAVRAGEHEVLVHLLFEHQSTVDERMPFRLLRYMVRLWETYLKEHPEARRLPLILPVVLHHSETGWTAATRLEELFDADAGLLAAAGPHVPRFAFVLDDLGEHGEEAIRERAMSALGRIALVCMLRARRPGELLEALRRLLPLVQEVLGAPSGRAALAAIWRYTLMVSEKMPAADVANQLVGVLGEALRKDVMTAGEELEARGVERGHREVLMAQLRGRFGALPDAFLTRIQSAGLEDLKRWAVRILTATTPDDVFAEG